MPFLSESDAYMTLLLKKKHYGKNLLRQSYFLHFLQSEKEDTLKILVWQIFIAVKNRCLYDFWAIKPLQGKRAKNPSYLVQPLTLIVLWTTQKKKKKFQIWTKPILGKKRETSSSAQCLGRGQVDRNEGHYLWSVLLLLRVSLYVMVAS